MRRGSIVAPILLIIIGGLFLLNNIRPDLPLLSIVGTWWPFLFVAWGALRLIEILTLWFRGLPLPRSGLSGGEWVLAVFVFLIGSGLSFSQRVISGWPEGMINLRGLDVFGEPYDYPLEATKAAGQTPRVVIENLRGNVRISAGTGEQIHVTGRKTIRSLERSTADATDKQTPLEIVANGDTYVVRTNQARASNSTQVSADLEVTVPEGASIEGHGRYGDYDITGIKGTVDLASDNAGVRIQDVPNSVRVDLRRSDVIRMTNIAGNVDVKGRGEDLELGNVGGEVVVNGSYSGDISFRDIKKQLTFTSPVTELSVAHIPGQIRFDLGDMTATDVQGPFRLKAQTKDVQVVDATDSVEIQLDRGDINIRQAKSPVPKMRVDTRSGNIELALPESASFQLKAATDRGEMENGFGSALQTETAGRGGTIRGQTGKTDGPLVEATTNRGSLVVRGLTGVLPLPPAPPHAPGAPLPPPAQPLELQKH
jgi:DUF4097 and DUF4098 domain-containing protein YvlB